MMRFIAVLAIVIAIVLGIIYAAGWMTVQSDSDSATIEIQTGEIKEAAQKAVDKGQELIDDAARSVNESSQSPSP
jgi:hypothetical protein